MRTHSALHNSIANQFSNAIPLCTAITRKNQQLPICCTIDRLSNALNRGQHDDNFKWCVRGQDGPAWFSFAPEDVTTKIVKVKFDVNVLPHDRHDPDPRKLDPRHPSQWKQADPGKRLCLHLHAGARSSRRDYLARLSRFRNGPIVPRLGPWIPEPFFIGASSQCFTLDKIDHFADSEKRRCPVSAGFRGIG